MQFNHAQTKLSAARLGDNRPTHFATGRDSCHFDDSMDRLMQICSQLILKYGVFHLSIHFSSSQLVCWTYDNPYSFQVYTAEEVFSRQFLRLFAPLDSHLHTCISHNQVDDVLQAFRALRQKRQGSELRNAAIHMINGYIALSFACDDTRYINFKNLIATAATGLDQAARSD